MGELLVHILFGAMVYPVCRGVFGTSDNIAIALLRSRAPVFLSDVIHYAPRILLPVAWIFAGFSFGPQADIYGGNTSNPNHALAWIYSLVWLFFVGALLLKAFVDAQKGHPKDKAVREDAQ